MRERLITTLTWPRLERSPTVEARGAIDRLYELKNLLEEAQGELDCLLTEPVTSCDWAKIAALKIKKARLMAAIIEQQARARDLEQAA